MPSDDAPNIEEVRDALDAINTLSSAFASAVESYNPPQIRVEIENGIYENVQLEAPGDAVFQLSTGYFWSTDLRGCHLVDIPADEIPDDIDLTDCRLRIDSDDGVPLLGGQIVDVGQQDGLGGNTTVVVGGGTKEVDDGDS